MSAQLGLNLPVRNALGRADFMVAPSNAVAVAMIEAWQDWPQGKLVLSGPEGSGKTHLTHVWAEMTGARIMDAQDLSEEALDPETTGPVAVEDVPRIAADMARQRALFHLHNMTLAAGHPLLLTGQAAPGFWNMSLPDLQSRIDAAGHAALDPPDDTLLSAVLAKLFHDRQLVPRPDVIPYLLTRMERSFARARAIVADLDRESLAQKKPVTRQFARQVLDMGPGAGA